jgi:hypothetical protein
MPGEKEDSAGRLRPGVACGLSRRTLCSGPQGVLTAACRHEPHRQGRGDIRAVQRARLLAQCAPPFYSPARLQRHVEEHGGL